MKFIFVALLFLLPLSSQALFEIRAGYGMSTLDEDTYGGAAVDDLSGFNVDAIFEPPLLTDLGLGVRYEKLTTDIGTTETDLERIAAIINYRLIDFITYFGFIGTIGLSNDLTVGNADYDANLNYSIGLEGGVNLGLIQIGVEVGKLFAEFERAGNPDLDLSGIYWKGLIGFGF